jgi:ectoine utilization protein EutC
LESTLLPDFVLNFLYLIINSHNFGKVLEMKIFLLTEKDLRECIKLDNEVIQAIENGFSQLSSHNVTMPPIMRLDFPEHNGEVDVKSAHVHGLDGFAIKVSSGFFDNRHLGLASLSGMMLLLSTTTGIPQAVLLDNGYLTDVRTGAAGAVAARYLANEKIETVGVIGAGSQARYQMIGLKQVRDFKKVLVYSLEGVADYIKEMGPILGVDVLPMPTVEAVVRESDVVVTTTPSKEPYLQAEWLHPGLHITAMGADAEDKQELFPETLKFADTLVCDSKQQVFRLGEFHHGKSDSVIDEQKVVELGEITSHRIKGRKKVEDITICDLTGTGMQDTVIATLAYQKALRLGLGQQIDS